MGRVKQETKPFSHAQRQARRRQMAGMVRKGRKPSAVATHFEVSMTTVRLACAEHAVPWPGLDGDK